ncbi:MAG: hypothetical protein DWI22_08855 [Planctomycetota bacterium]|nr:hypothetical protein [Planctomycetales bacterium]RLT07986.1 MAG: hypothetical protein DWI22_08855 [Planctomycetota bacterium]
MLQFLHILTAVTLMFPVGLLECATCCKDCSSSTCVLEDAPAEDAESISRLEIDKHRVFLDLQHPPGFACSVLWNFLPTDSLSVDRDCVEMRGCRPPPLRGRA